MKVLKKLLYAIPIAGIIFASCTDVEKMEIEHIGGFNTMNNEESEAYFQRSLTEPRRVCTNRVSSERVLVAT